MGCKFETITRLNDNWIKSITGQKEGVGYSELKDEVDKCCGINRRACVVERNMIIEDK